MKKRKGLEQIADEECMAKAPPAFADEAFGSQDFEEKGLLEGQSGFVITES